jgi:hypothetical protein
VGPPAKDAVPGDETVWMPQKFINVIEFSGLNVRAGYKFVLAGGRHLIKPSELAFRANFKTVLMKRICPDN